MNGCKGKNSTQSWYLGCRPGRRWSLGHRIPSGSSAGGFVTEAEQGPAQPASPLSSPLLCCCHGPPSPEDTSSWTQPSGTPSSCLHCRMEPNTHSLLGTSARHRYSFAFVRFFNLNAFTPHISTTSLLHGTTSVDLFSSFYIRRLTLDKREKY